MAYSQEVADAICARLAEGENLREICRGDGMPNWRTVYDWKDEQPEFAARFARAREVGFDAIAAECVEIADNTEEGVERTVRPDGSVEERRGDMLGHRKLQIETRLKLLARWTPRYSERMAIGGSAELPPIRSESTVTLSAEDAYKQMLNGPK